jgi:NADH-quinone oxidoreductase subunit M
VDGSNYYQVVMIGRQFLNFITLERSVSYNIEIATIMLKITPLGWFFLLLLASAFPMAILFSITFIKKNAGGFYAAMITSMIGSMGILLAQDILSFYMFWEIMSWSILALVLRSHDKKAIMSYLSFGVLSAMLILLGIMLLYSETGTFVFSEMGFMANNTTLIALSLLVSGFAVKGVLVPMHVWAPYVYSRSEEPFVAFLSGGLSKLGYFAMILFMYGVVGISVLNSWGTFRRSPKKTWVRRGSD